MDYTTDGYLDDFVDRCVKRDDERAKLRACLIDLGLDCKERFDELPYDRATLERLVVAGATRYASVQVLKQLFGAATATSPDGVVATEERR